MSHGGREIELSLAKWNVFRDKLTCPPSFSIKRDGTTEVCPEGPRPGQLCHEDGAERLIWWVCLRCSVILIHFNGFSYLNFQFIK